METIANLLLHFSLPLGIYIFFASIQAGRSQSVKWLQSTILAQAVFITWIFACSALLVGCLLMGKYHLAYVYSYSNSTMPTFYKIAALWGGQNGSLLWWLTILCGYVAVLIWQHRKSRSTLFPYVLTTLSAIQVFFVVLLIFAANPFDIIPTASMGGIQDGKGLNALLQNYYMIIHPPSLYLGYVGMSVPFAFAMAALISGKLDNEWIIVIRKWTLTAWFFLSLGNLLGASWAYEVLGWGGYWAWDPVENAAFMPWLTASAFLHSVIIQEKRNMLKVWNMILIILSFVLTLTGTFLTRSGIVSSVHSFAQSDIGAYFLTFLILTIVVSSAFLIYRLKDLDNKNTLDSMFSREAAFLLNNLVFVGAAVAILWGTIFPVLSEAVRGVKISIGPPYFNTVMIPIGLMLLLLTGIGPMIAWRKTSLTQLKKTFYWPVMASIVATIVTTFVTRHIWVVLTFAFSAFVLATIFIEYRNGVLIRMRALKENFGQALVRLVRKNERRYGGYIVHFGIVLLFIGFSGAAFKVEKEFQMTQNQAEKLGKYTFRYDGIEIDKNDHREIFTSKFSIWKNDQPHSFAYPAKVLYQSQIPGEPPQPGTNVFIKRSMIEDLYFALLSFDEDHGTAFIKVIVNPMVQYIWIGGLFLMLGTMVVMWPKPAVRKHIS